MQLRDYQQDLVQRIYAAWDSGAINVCMQLPTGGGKTAIFSHIIANFSGPSIAIAHRTELVSQISLTLARHGVRHGIVAQPAVIRQIISIHLDETGRSWYDPLARCRVAGVDTLVRLPPDTAWFNEVQLVVQDEGHHPLKKNKWGRAAGLFPRARGLYPTATPIRADGNGLGRHADGVHDVLIVGVPMRKLIRQGHLTEYRIFAPHGTLDLSTVPLSASGDYSPPKLRDAVYKAQITGDVVSHYLKIAPGKLGVTFAVSVDAATDIAREFCDAGVPAEVISGNTPEGLRAHIMRRFRAREILQIVNVDLLGEGVDVPAIEVISFARPTNSICVFFQQFGRALRPMPGKSHAIIIDHVGNVLRHGLPDRPRTWSLDRRERRGRGAPDDAIPVRSCISCTAVYERTSRACPYCGHYMPPASRGSPEEVDGDLTELAPDVLARLRGEIDRVDGAPSVPQHLDHIAQRGAMNRHRERQDAQHALRETIAIWAGHLKALLRHEDSQIYREFYFRFNIDIASAQTLGATAATALNEKIKIHIDTIRNKR